MATMSLRAVAQRLIVSASSITNSICLPSWYSFSWLSDGVQDASVQEDGRKKVESNSAVSDLQKRLKAPDNCGMREMRKLGEHSTCQGCESNHWRYEDEAGCERSSREGGSFSLLFIPPKPGVKASYIIFLNPPSICASGPGWKALLRTWVCTSNCQERTTLIF